MIFPKFKFSAEDMKELEKFLISHSTPKPRMDISQLNGFLTGILVGPDTIPPSQWMPEVFEEDGEEKIWDSETEAERVIGLILSYYNTLAKLLMEKTSDYQPLLHLDRVDDCEAIDIVPWCRGFMQAVVLNSESWEELFTSEEDSDLLFPMIVYGTETGQELLNEEMGDRQLPIEDWAGFISLQVQQIHEYWLPYRRSYTDAIRQSAQQQKVGRNDPCPCGSGKKFKNCCMN